MPGCKSGSRKRFYSEIVRGEAILLSEEISISFPGVKALVDINEGIESGEFCPLLGPSGCGKTTLLRTVRTK